MGGGIIWGGHQLDIEGFQAGWGDSVLMKGVPVSSGPRVEGQFPVVLSLSLKDHLKNKEKNKEKAVCLKRGNGPWLWLYLHGNMKRKVLQRGHLDYCITKHLVYISGC